MDGLLLAMLAEWHGGRELPETETADLSALYESKLH